MRFQFLLNKLIIIGCLFCNNGYAQIDSVKNTSYKKTKFYILETDTVPEFDKNIDTAFLNKKKKKVKKKKNFFYEQKCRKGFIRSYHGDNEILETFYFLKTWKDPNSFIKDIYVWDMLENKIIKVNNIDAKKIPQYKILHGPYKKEVNGVETELGAFYIGTKHARWEYYDKNFILIDKVKYYKGWPKDAQLSYYDSEQKKLKEVMPYEFGELNGDYYYFTEDGNILNEGQYLNGVKVGLWIEYFPNSTKRKRETRYPSTPFEDTPPIIQKEWDDKGRIIIAEGKAIDPNSSEVEKHDPIKSRLKKRR